jgi:hypothetical protein
MLMYNGPVACWTFDASIGLFLRSTQRCLAGKNHGRSSSSEPGVVVRALRSDNAANRHEETKLWTVLATSDKDRLAERKRIEGVPKCCSRANHVFAECSHNAVRSSTILEDGDSSYNPDEYSATTRHPGELTDDESHDTTDSCK